MIVCMERTDLTRALQGRVLTAVSPGNDRVRQPAIANYHGVRPRRIVQCTSAADVAAAVGVARQSGLPLAIRGGGHCFAGGSSSTGLVIDLSGLKGVGLSDDVATIGAGVRLGELYDELARHGRTVPAGCGPSVGIAGLALGGGLGILGRLHGLTCDRLVAADVVLADGRLVRCDETRHPDLFWALRGGGAGRVGVVTSLEFATVPATGMTSFYVRWARMAAVEVIDAWQHWSPNAPDPLAASLLVSAGGAAGRDPVVTLFGAWAGDAAQCRELLDEFAAHAGVAPEAADVRQASLRQAKTDLASFDTHGLAGQIPDGYTYCTSEFFDRPIPADAISLLLSLLTNGRLPGELRELDFTPMGGAYNRIPPDATAFVHRTDRYLLKHATVLPTGAVADDRSSARLWLTRSSQVAQRFGTGRGYQNFPQAGQDPTVAAATHYGSNLARLDRISHTYDPDGLFKRHLSERADEPILSPDPQEHQR